MPNSKTGSKGHLRLVFDVEFPSQQLSADEGAQLKALIGDGSYYVLHRSSRGAQ